MAPEFIRNDMIVSFDRNATVCIGSGVRPSRLCAAHRQWHFSFESVSDHGEGLAGSANPAVRA
jgi:hypothetical protein